MWLPTPIYERIPQFFFLLGILFMTAGIYIGFDIAIAFAYVSFGALCSTYGIGIFVVRMLRRKGKPPAESDAPYFRSETAKPVSD